MHAARDSAPFSCNAERRVGASDRKELESLLSYMARAPIALERLQYRDDGRALYRGKFHPGLNRDQQLCSAIEFLALVVPHIALRYESLFRMYGALSTTLRKRFGWIASKDGAPTSDEVTVIDGDEDSEFVALRRKNWARLVARTWLVDPSLCDGCGKPMKAISAISSPEQDVIERILRARVEWDPPWLRERRVRGPALPSVRSRLRMNTPDRLGC